MIRNPLSVIVKPVIIYTPTQERGYNPRQRRWGVCSVTNCKHIFGFYYKSRESEFPPTRIVIGFQLSVVSYKRV